MLVSIVTHWIRKQNNEANIEFKTCENSMSNKVIAVWISNPQKALFW